MFSIQSQFYPWLPVFSLSCVPYFKKLMIIRRWFLPHCLNRQSVPSDASQPLPH